MECLFAKIDRNINYEGNIKATIPFELCYKHQYVKWLEKHKFLGLAL